MNTMLIIMRSNFISQKKYPPPTHTFPNIERDSLPDDPKYK